MPRGTVDYQKGLIYTIKTGDSLYVGSTTDFRKRKCKHKSLIKTKKERTKLYETIINNGDEWEMKPYKMFPCNSKLELEIEEEKIRRELNADLNGHKCCYINKEKESKEKVAEWREVNKQQIKEKVGNYYQNNKEKILQQKREYYRKKKEENK